MNNISSLSFFLKLLVVIALCGFAIFARLDIHIWNATPVMPIIMVIAIMFGREFKQSIIMAMLATLGIMLISDAVLGFYSWTLMSVVYASLALTGVFGFILARLPRKSLLDHASFFGLAIGTSILGALLFFVTTNFAVWAFGTGYSKNWTGFFECYKMALPFFRGSLLGNILWGATIFGGFIGLDTIIKMLSPLNSNANSTS